MNLIDAVLIRRADEQMQTSWVRPTRREAREETRKGPRTCLVEGCYHEIPEGDRHTVCSACRRRGLVATPCKGCGGKIRRCDQTGPAADRRGYCASCRSGMTRRQGGWQPGQSGNPTGRMRGHKPEAA